jgi:hypothetical protein
MGDEIEKSIKLIALLVSKMTGISGQKILGTCKLEEIFGCDIG